MTNDFFDDTKWAQIQRLSLARSALINAIVEAVVAGFDLMPAKARIYEGRVTYCGNDTGAANAYIVTAPYTITLTDGMHLRWRPASTNTGASTLNASGLGSIAVVNFAGAALTGGELAAGVNIDTVYNSGLNQYRIINPLIAVASVVVNNLGQNSATDTVPGYISNKVTVQANGGLKRTLNNAAGNENEGYGLDQTNLVAYTAPLDADLMSASTAGTAKKITLANALITGWPTITVNADADTFTVLQSSSGLLKQITRGNFVPRRMNPVSFFQSQA